MMTAYDAFKAAKEQRRKVADEFIINEVQTAIRQSTDAGLFCATIEVHDPKVLTAIDTVRDALRELGYQVSLTDATLGSPCCLEITYEVGEEQ